MLPVTGTESCVIGMLLDFAVRILRLGSVVVTVLECTVYCIGNGREGLWDLLLLRLTLHGVWNQTVSMEVWYNRPIAVVFSALIVNHRGISMSFNCAPFLRPLFY